MVRREQEREEAIKNGKRGSADNFDGTREKTNTKYLAGRVGERSKGNKHHLNSVCRERLKQKKGETS